VGDWLKLSLRSVHCPHIHRHTLMHSHRLTNTHKHSHTLTYTHIRAYTHSHSCPLCNQRMVPDAKGREAIPDLDTPGVNEYTAIGAGGTEGAGEPREPRAAGAGAGAGSRVRPVSPSVRPISPSRDALGLPRFYQVAAANPAAAAAPSVTRPPIEDPEIQRWWRLGRQERRERTQTGSHRRSERPVDADSLAQQQGQDAAASSLVQGGPPAPSGIWN
jgi:hypothetical protein